MSEAEVRLAALEERDALVRQAMETHKSNVEFELRRFARDMADVERVYQLRLSGWEPEQQGDPCGVNGCRERFADRKSWAAHARAAHLS